MRKSLILCVLLIASSCEKIVSPIIGKWQFIIDIGNIQSETERILTFKSDGTATFGIGDELTMEIIDGKTLNYTWNIDYKGILNFTSIGGTMKFQRY